MKHNKLDPLSLLKLFEIMDTPFDKQCVCGQKHRISLDHFDLTSTPTTLKSTANISCQTHLRYLQQLPSYGFGTELDTHLVNGRFQRRVIKFMLAGIAFFSGVKVKS